MTGVLEVDWSGSGYGRKKVGFFWTQELILWFREMRCISLPDEDLWDFWSVMLRPELALIIKPELALIINSVKALLLLLTSSHFSTSACCETFTYPTSSVWLGSVRGRKFALSLKVKVGVLAVCLLYDTFVMSLLSAPLLRCFRLNLCSLDILSFWWPLLPHDDDDDDDDDNNRNTQYVECEDNSDTGDHRSDRYYFQII